MSQHGLFLVRNSILETSDHIFILFSSVTFSVFHILRDTIISPAIRPLSHYSIIRNSLICPFPSLTKRCLLIPQVDLLKLHLPSMSEIPRLYALLALRHLWQIVILYSQRDHWNDVDFPPLYSKQHENSVHIWFAHHQISRAQHTGQQKGVAQ